MTTLREAPHVSNEKVTSAHHRESLDSLATIDVVSMDPPGREALVSSPSPAIPNREKVSLLPANSEDISMMTSSSSHDEMVVSWLAEDTIKPSETETLPTLQSNENHEVTTLKNAMVSLSIPLKRVSLSDYRKKKQTTGPSESSILPETDVSPPSLKSEEEELLQQTTIIEDPFVHTMALNALSPVNEQENTGETGTQDKEEKEEVEDAMECN
jgi:hypothetical protein